MSETTETTETTETAEITAEAVREIENVLLIENDIKVINETEFTTETEAISKVKEVPAYVISLSNDLWVQDNNGWYVYRYPILPNETIQVDAEILVIDPEWEGALELYFEAEAQDVSSGGGYE